MGMRVDGDSFLRWRAVEGARGYLIYRNDSLQDFTDRLVYDVVGKTGEKYAIRTLNQAGIPGSAVPRLENIITWEQDTEVVYGDPNVALTGTTNSGLPITYTSSDTTVLRVVDNSELEILWIDNVTITATQSGNAAYAPAAPISKIFTVLAFRPDPQPDPQPDPTGVDRHAQIPVSIYPNPVNDLLNISFEQEGTYEVKLIDLTGSVIYRASVKGGSHAIDVSSYLSGTYLLCIENVQKKRTVQKVGIR